MNLIAPASPKPLTFTRPLILAFYQMNWFSTRQGEDLKKLNAFYQDPTEWRNMIIHTASGKLLKAVFKDLYDTIVWRMPNPGPRKEVYSAGFPVPSLTDFDEGYLRHLIGNLKPEIVLGLGTSAQEGIGRVVCQVPVRGICLFGKHPLEEGAADSLRSLLIELNSELLQYAKN